MKSASVGLTNLSSAQIPIAQLTAVANALQIQIDRDFSPAWGGNARILPIAATEVMPSGFWALRVVDQACEGGGVHLNKNNVPYAEITADVDWTITASHELLEMLADPFGQHLAVARDINPGSAGRKVQYLVEVADPCEVFQYSINGVLVSDFVLPDFYNDRATPGTIVDHLNHLSGSLTVPKGCYLSWLDPVDQRWHQRNANGAFVSSKTMANFEKNPRDGRDLAFSEDADRHALTRLRKLAIGDGLATREDAQ